MKKRELLWYLPLLLVVLYIVAYNTATPKNVLLIVFSYIAAINDFRYKTVSMKLIIVMLGCWVLLSCYYFVFTDAYFNTIFLTGLIGFALGGVFLLPIYIFSKKGVGEGDIIFLATVGLYMGGSLILAAIMFSLIIALVTVVILLVSKRKTRKDSIAFIPFIFVGILSVLLL